MEGFKELGLNSYEIEIYRALLRNGISTGKQLSEYSKVPPTAVYPNLNNLKDKQLVQKFEGDPALFEALPPAFAIKNLVERKKNRLLKLQEKTTLIAQEIVAKPEKKEQNDGVIITHGRGTSAAAYFDSIKDVRKTFYILGWRLIKVKDKYAFLHEFKKLVKKGIDVRIILTGPPNKKWEVVSSYIDAGVKVRYLPIDNFSIFVVDQKKCKISLKSKELTKRFNLQFLDDSFAKAMHNYFMTMWQKAKRIEGENR